MLRVSRRYAEKVKKPDCFREGGPTTAKGIKAQLRKFTVSTLLHRGYSFDKNFKLDLLGSLDALDTEDKMVDGHAPKTAKLQPHLHRHRCRRTATKEEFDRAKARKSTKSSMRLTEAKRKNLRASTKAPGPTRVRVAGAQKASRKAAGRVKAAVYCGTPKLVFWHHRRPMIALAKVKQVQPATRQAPRQDIMTVPYSQLLDHPYRSRATPLNDTDYMKLDPLDW